MASAIVKFVRLIFGWTLNSLPIELSVDEDNAKLSIVYRAQTCFVSSGDDLEAYDTKEMGSGES